MTLRCGSQGFCDQRVYVMGIVNVTPDSFSDAGVFFRRDRAVAHAEKLVLEGADIIDIGGVATSPHVINSDIVDEDEEMRRVLPVIKELVKRGIRNLSVDTSRARVAHEALLLGASWINDQSAGLNDPSMPEVMARAQGIVLMHNGGGPSGVEAGNRISYHDVIEDVLLFFRTRIAVITAAGVRPEHIVVDPGIGFGKGLADSLSIINNMHRFQEVAAVNLIGLSRKSFLYPLCGIKDPACRDYASLGATAAAILSGARIIRTHNVRATVEMARVFTHCLTKKIGRF
jgi:dihydropteroate synthase